MANVIDSNLIKGINFISQGNFESAINELNIVLNKDPDHYEANRHLGLIKFERDELEEADERRFNRKINLGINAEDMVGMINSRFNDANIELRDLKPFTFPSQTILNEKKIRSVMLGYYIPWDVKEQVKLIKKELDWIGDTVEGVPPEYDYEKIECYMQGMRDYIKYLKRGFGRTAHLTSIDIRNGRLDRETALDLCKKFDGKKPVVLEIFLKTLKISEEEFMNIVSRHVVEPFEMPNKKDIKSSNLLLDGLKDFEKKIL